MIYRYYDFIGFFFNIIVKLPTNDCYLYASGGHKDPFAIEMEIICRN